MQSFLGVPIIGRERPLGNLYLTEKIGSTEFTEEDEAVAVMLAAQAAVAVENATLYEEGQRLIQEVRAMQTSRDRFFATINHELRNALTAVYGWADLLIRKVGPDGPRAAREVYESAERTLGLLNDLLDLSRLEAERLRPTVRDADAQQLVAEALASVEPVAKERAVELHAVGLDHSAPCQTDAQRVRQILINVLTNAIRHSPDGDTVTVRTDVTDQQLRFTVIDHGPGIPAEEQSHIFEAFHRAGTSDERGTGLGLTLSRQLALLLGGDLTVESHLGEGASFILNIPRRFGKS
jgi:signal transduction histidine kinase